MIPSPRRIAAAAAGRAPSPLARMLDIDRRAAPSVGDLAVASMSYGHLRLGRIGDVDPMPIRTVSTDVARRADLDEFGLDLVVVPGPSRRGPRRLDSTVREALIACERAGVPTVLLVDRPDDLATDIAPLVAAMAASSPDAVGRARRIAGDERVAAACTVVAPCGTVDVSRATDEVIVVAGASAPHDLVAAVGSAGGVARVLRPGGGPRRVARLAARASAVVGPDLDDAPVEQRHLVLSLAARGIPVVTEDDTTVDRLRRLIGDAAARSVAGIEAQRCVRRANSLDAWFDAVLPTVRVPVVGPPTVSVVVDLSTPDAVDRLAANVARQAYREVEVVAATPDPVTVERCRHVLGDATVVVGAAAGSTRGERLTSAVGRATGRWIAFFDERAVYGPWHLMDLVLDARASAAEVVGRSRCAMYDPDRDVTGRWAALGGHRSRSRIAPGTSLVRREVATRHGFPRLLGDPHRRLVDSVTRAGGRVRTIHEYDVVLTGPVRGGDVVAGFDTAGALVFGDGGVPVVPPRGRCGDG